MIPRWQILPGLSSLGVVVLAACTPSVPESGVPGVGFQDYNSYIRDNYQRGNSAGLPGGAAGQGQTPLAATPPAASTGFDPSAAAAAIDRAEGGSSAPPPAIITNPDAGVQGAAILPYNSLGSDTGATNTGVRPRGGAPAGIKEESGELAHSNPSISDENDFNAVAARETIASDADRIARNRAEYVVIQPGALPVRQGESGPNIVEYALATNNAPGVAMYSRGRSSKDPNIACAKYTSPDLAQEAFLAAGGPDKDRHGLDPDGDGFACGWDPRPFRTALQ
ncbi:hypothetical protein HOY34_00330 [Xinfangfangia sp. D13-10-4-6]|uniref:hypothetical protein n=1 Tax=Pseudogemmobacter hezensis TaxID=2737662 RepID=UPI001556E661|nr:hypothetical protein [Pseudogemmobacter hezensis]NPD13645.1 hypothetical protein [Pseudogemmobacter hezensis]